VFLEWMADKRNDPGLANAARAIQTAVDEVLADPALRTADLGGPLGTAAFGEAVARRTGTIANDGQGSTRS